MSVFPSQTNFVTGDILTATAVNEIGQAINLLDGAQGSAGKNRVLNSNMSVWQRGTSIAVAASSGIAYTADRWSTSTGASQACTVSRQLTGDTTNLPHVQYAMRFQRNSGQTGTAGLNVTQSMETINSIPLAGKAVVFSFYARAGANYSAAASALGVFVVAGTGTDQNWFSGYTGQTTPINSGATLTTTWQRFTFTGTIAATATEITPIFTFTPVGTAGANDYFEVTGVQLEAANSVSNYAPNGATYQAELAACQRYYWRSTPGVAYATYCSASASSATGGIFATRNPVTMRTIPTAVEWANLEACDYPGNIFAITAGSVAISIVATQNNLICGFTSAGMANNGNYVIRNANNTAGYLGFSAEL
jgi:hypothetical protein